jgi:hypothetical protein
MAHDVLLVRVESEPEFQRFGSAARGVLLLLADRLSGKYWRPIIDATRTRGVPEAAEVVIARALNVGLQEVKVVFRWLLQKGVIEAEYVPSSRATMYRFNDNAVVGARRSSPAPAPRPVPAPSSPPLVPDSVDAALDRYLPPPLRSTSAASR